MHRITPATTEMILRNYFHAKDENRPHLLRRVFTSDARLQIINNTETIAFPAESQGREAIADVLVRRFGQTYENVYSFYMARPQTPMAAFACDWLVGMSEKDKRHVRVGCGCYDWEFEQAAPNLASRLVITIDTMQVLPPHRLPVIMQWLQQLVYPWTSPAAVIETAPDIVSLEPVLRFFAQKGANPSPSIP